MQVADGFSCPHCVAVLNIMLKNEKPIPVARFETRMSFHDCVLKKDGDSLALAAMLACIRPLETSACEGPKRALQHRIYWSDSDYQRLKRDLNDADPDRLWALADTEIERAFKRQEAQYNQWLEDAVWGVYDGQENAHSQYANTKELDEAIHRRIDEDYEEMRELRRSELKRKLLSGVECSQPSGAPKRHGWEETNVVFMDGQTFQPTPQHLVGEKMRKFQADVENDYRAKEAMVERLGEEENPVMEVSPPKAKPKPSKGKKQRHRQKRNGNGNDARVANAESAVNGSLLIPEDRFSSSCAMDLGDNVMANGFLMRGANELVHFVTRRHMDPDGGGDMNHHLVEGKEYTFHRYPDTTFKSKVVVHGGTNDRLILTIHNKKGLDDLPANKFLKKECWPQGVVTMKAFVPTPKGNQWVTSMGVVTTTNSFTFGYSLTTEIGCCRAAIYDAVGRIVGGHVFAKTGGKPAGWYEHGDIVTTIQTQHSLNLATQGGGSGLNYPPGVQPRRPDSRKIWPTNRDKNTGQPYKYIRVRHHMMRPSTDMVKKEVKRFQDHINFSLPADMLSAATKAATALLPVGQPYQLPTVREAATRMLPLLTGVHSSGVSSTMSQSDYIGSLADSNDEHAIRFAAEHQGDLPEVRLLGLFALARTVVHFLQHLDDPDEHDLLFGKRLQQWTVNGKTDGYKEKKIAIGRSIQAPSIELKALWKVVCSDAEKAWSEQNLFFRTGEDLNMPLSATLKRYYLGGKAALALDATAWDRYMPSELILAYVKYLSYIMPGMPSKLAGYLFTSIANSTMFLTDGDILTKRRGNPSGHPATLWLNCFVNLLTWVSVLALKNNLHPNDVVETFEEDVFPEFCGDDSRIWALTEKGKSMLGCDEEQPFSSILDVFKKYFPWEMKVEGSWVRDESKNIKEDFLSVPPLVSRGLLLQEYARGWIVWTPYIDVNRVLKKLVHDMSRTEAEEEEHMLAYSSTLALLEYWDSTNIVRVPAMTVLREHRFWSKELARRVVVSYYRHALLS